MNTRGQFLFQHGDRSEGFRLRSARWGLCAFLILGCSTALLAQESGRPQGGSGRNTGETTFTIKGRIYMPTGAPADEQLRVTLKTFSQGVAQELYSDTVGNYEFKNVPINSYEVVVWGTDRFETTTERVEIYGRVGRLVFQNIFLVAKEARDPHPRRKGSTVSVAELKAKIPRDAEQSYRRGTRLVEDKLYEESVVHFLAAIEFFPTYFQALNDLGVQYVRLRKFDEALDVLHRASAIAPTAPQPWINIAHALILSGKADQALVPLKRATDLDSSNWLVHVLLGMAHYQTGDALRARQEYEKALVLGEMPQAAVVHLHIANLHIRQGEFTRAISECERYLKECPDGADAAEATAKLNMMRRTMSGEPIEISDRP